MNERIQELVKQARRYAEDKQNDPLRVYTLDVFTEKFAELIVQECAKLHANKLEKRPCSEYNKGRIELAQEIKDHFGVE